MRREGFSYSEILKKIPVAKSTLSLWLRSVTLTTRQQQKLTNKKLIAIQKGGQARHNQRLALMSRIEQETKQDVKSLDNKHLWLAGVMLYWAEGSKEKKHNIGQPLCFNNSDPRMIKFFVKWLIEIIEVDPNDIKFSIYIHKDADAKKALSFWSKTLSCDKSTIPVYFKKPKHKTNRRNTGEGYNGLLRVGVRKSSTLNRRVAAWISHICNYCGIV
ncbi:MAG: hypothetical protein G01um101419_48 [Parcubacteria group bacterium Gr01-1014_19]|nr:MAG: hypothetical protein G01um101419_48 [Parcubacteria group bacterium Gr01-1014_19]